MPAPPSLAPAPYLGVGISLSLQASPDPARLARAPGGPDFVEYAGRVDPEDVKEPVARIRAAGKPVLFHPSFVNFCGSYPNAEAWLEEAARHVEAVGSPWFAQDCAYCFWGEGHGYSTQLGYFIPPILNEASLSRAVERVREVKAQVPVPVAVEPPPMTFAVGSMPLLTFFGRLAEAADCALLFDMGHLVSYERATGREVEEQLHHLPKERVLEVHIAGGRLEGPGGVYIDDHAQGVLPEVWAKLEALLPELPEVRAVCFECEGTTEAHVLETLRRLRALVAERSASGPLRERAREGAG